MSSSRLIPTHFIVPALIMTGSILALNLPIQSQTRQSTITGQVTDAGTGEALHFVNIFLAGTTLGDATDSNGYYVIRNIPPGTYELVVSMMGYEIRKRKVRLSNQQRLTIQFSLEPRILQGEEVVVTADDPKEWRRNLKIFENAFFCMNEFAKDCRILNPEVLDFDYDRSSGVFQAYAEQPMRFVNDALGYEILYLMEKFKAELFNDNLYGLEKVGDNPLLRKGTRINNGTAVFKELIPMKEDDKKKWEKNRLIAYNGSLRHFFSALIGRQLKEEGFDISGSRRFGSRTEYAVKADTLLRQGADPSERILSFPNYLRVIYKKEKDAIEYEMRMLILEGDRFPDQDHLDRFMMKTAIETSHQRSWLRIARGETITINMQGSIVSGSGNFFATGYWWWDSPAEWLPMGYKPNE